MYLLSNCFVLALKASQHKIQMCIHSDNHLGEEDKDTSNNGPRIHLNNANV